MAASAASLTVMPFGYARSSRRGAAGAGAPSPGPARDPLPPPLPGAGGVAFAPAAVGGDRQRGGVRVALPAEVLPPGADALDREGGGVVLDPDRHPAGVVGKVVDAVGDRLAELGVLEVVHAHRERRAPRAPRAPTRPPRSVCEAPSRTLAFACRL